MVSSNEIGGMAMATLVAARDADTLVLSLDDLARRINAAHDGALGGVRTALEHARLAGALLLEARARCPHGAWLPWLADSVAFSERTAQGYMRVARRWPELVDAANPQFPALLTVDGALHLLAAPKDAPLPEAPPGRRTLSELEQSIDDGIARLRDSAVAMYRAGVAAGVPQALGYATGEAWLFGRLGHLPHGYLHAIVELERGELSMATIEAWVRAAEETAR